MREPWGAWNLPRVLAHLEAEGELPEVARQVLRLLAAQLEEAEGRLGELDARIAAWHKASPGRGARTSLALGAESRRARSRR
jgi:hypothetical protein